MERYKFNGFRETVCPTVQRARAKVESDNLEREKNGQDTLDAGAVRCQMEANCGWSNCLYENYYLNLSAKEKETHLIIPLTPDARKNKSE